MSAPLESPVDAQEPSGQRAGGLSQSQVKIVFAGLILGMVLGAMDGTIVTTALPTIVGELGGLEHLSWVGTVYLLVSTATVPLYGKLSDIYGRRVMFRLAIAVFLIGSVLTGLSQTMFQLIVFRGAQGLGGGGLMSMGMAIIGEVVSPRERGRFMGYLTPVFFLASVAGPVLGGFFVDYLSWRWIFYVNLPLGIAALIVTNNALRVLPFTPRKARLDFPGAALLLAGVSCLLLVSTWGGRTYAWTSPELLALGGVALVLVVLFVLQEMRAAEPILPIRLFNNPVFTVVNLMSFFTGAAMMGALVFLPLYLQAVRGASATGSGIGLFPIIAGIMGASVVTGRLITRWGRYKAFCVIGMAIAPVALYALAGLDREATAAVYSGCLVILGVGIGMVLPVTTLAVQNGVDYEDLGVATASVSFCQSLGGTLGLAVFGAYFNARFASEALRRAPAKFADPDTIASLAQSPADIRALEPAVADAITGAIATAVQATFVAAVPVLILGLIAALWLKELPLQETAHVTTRLVGLD